MKPLFYLSVILISLSASAQKPASSAQHPDRLESGLAIGKDCPAFDPWHLSGPDKGTRACPMCKYGYQQGVMVWVNTDDWTNIVQMASALEAEVSKKGLRHIRAFIIYMNPDEKSREEVEKLLATFIARAQLTNVAVTWVPNPVDLRTAGSYKINPDKRVRNTVIVYRNRGVFAKVINLEATHENMQSLFQSIENAEKTKGF